MKYNLNNYVIGSTQFIELLSERLKFKAIDVNTYEKQYSDYNTYLLPYHYMKEQMSIKDWESFKVFYNQLLNKSGIIYEENIDNIFITTDIAMIYTFIVAAQYYFL